MFKLEPYLSTDFAIFTFSKMATSFGQSSPSVRVQPHEGDHPAHKTLVSTPRKPLLGGFIK